MKIDALLDSNVVIAIIFERHVHHNASLALIAEEGDFRFAVSAHSYAEAYSTLTRTGSHMPFRLPPDEAWEALESVRAVTALLGLTAPQTFDAIRRYSQDAGIGPRLYDRLIGETAVVHDIAAIVTWNVGHMKNLFPALQVVTPGAFVEAGNGKRTK